MDAYSKRKFGCYLKEMAQSDGRLETDANGWPVYMVTYCLMRAGKYKEAATFAAQSEHRKAKKLARYLQHYLANELSLVGEPLDKALRKLELRHDKTSSEVDPYQEAIYLVLTKQHKDPQDKLIMDIEDYMWFYLKIVHANEAEDEPAYAKAGLMLLPLADFQSTIVGLGAERFSHNNELPLDYFKTLLLIGLYSPVKLNSIERVGCKIPC